MISSEEKVSKNVSEHISTRLTSVAWNVNVSVNNAHISSIIDLNKYNSLVKLLNITKLVLRLLKFLNVKIV